LLQSGERVIGVDNINDYYPVALKEARLDELAQFGDFRFHRLDIAERGALGELMARERESETSRDLGFHPATPIEEGLPRFVAWFRAYHGL
jgi:nucleoside-diphosphate-sugar epimerase